MCSGSAIVNTHKLTRKPVGYFIWAGCTVHVFTSYIASFVKCSGVSMQPAICDREIVLVERISSMLGHHERGNVILAKSLHSNDPQLLICKRITAIPYDFIPSETVEHDSLSDRECVPRGHVWVEGDNKSVSLDSREYGPLPIGLIQGRFVFRVWPLSRMGLIPRTSQRHCAQQ